MNEYKVKYEITLIYGGLLGAKEIVKDGVEIIQADSFIDAQNKTDEKFKKVSDSESGDTAVWPVIKDIELLNKEKA